MHRIKEKHFHRNREASSSDQRADTLPKKGRGPRLSCGQTLFAYSGAMTHPQRVQAQKRIRAMIQANPLVTNGDMADVLTAEMNAAVSARDISRLRNNVGLGAHHPSAQEASQTMEAETLARLFAQQGVRNTILEDFHSGRIPHSRAGDYSDVKVVTPGGDIPWNQVSRLSDPEMRALMLNVEQNLARLFLELRAAERAGKLGEMLQEMRQELFSPHGVSWDRPAQNQQDAAGNA